MYIWEVECLTRWSFHAEDESDSEEYVVCGKDYYECIQKVTKVALNKKRAFKDTGDDGISHTHTPISISDFIKIERKNWIDG